MSAKNDNQFENRRVFREGRADYPLLPAMVRKGLEFWYDERFWKITTIFPLKKCDEKYY